jgi:hypothetical protein
MIAPKIINKGYKPNMTMSMICACIAHYKQYERPIECITLHPNKWDEFKRGMLEKFPEREDDFNHFEYASFHNLDVKKGSQFMVKSLEVTLKERVLE